MMSVRVSTFYDPVKKMAYAVLDPVVRGLRRLGITPNAVTLASLFFCGVAAVCIAAGYWAFALTFVVLGGVCDMLDGHLARLSGTESRGGAFLDSFVDRLSDGLLFGGFAMFGAYHSPLLTMWAVVALVGAHSTSYARARAGSLKVDAKVGLLQRPGRVILTGVTLALASLSPIQGWNDLDILHLWVPIVAVGSLATALYRAKWVIRELGAA